MDYIQGMLAKKETERQKKALQGFELRQKKFIRNLGSANTVTEAALNAGYSESTARGTIFHQLKSKRMQKALQLYYAAGDVGLGILGASTITDLLTSEGTSEEGRINSSKLALQVSGKLKNININQNSNINIDIPSELIAKVLHTPQHIDIDPTP